MKRLFVLLSILAVSVSAHAQDVPRLEIRAAVGASTYLHGDLDYTAAVVLVSVRGGSRTVVVAPEFAIARHSGHESVLGVTRDERATFQSFAFNIVRRWPNRVTPFVGGGIGVFMDEHRSSVHGPALDTIPPTLTRQWRSGGQAIGGADVRIAPHLGIVGEGRYEVRSSADPLGGSAWQVLAGVTVAVF